MQTIINSGFYQFAGTDRFEKPEEPSEAYKQYRENWKNRPLKKELGPFPLHLDIESTNACNLKCDMCVRNFMKEKIGMMSFDLFKKIIDEAAAHNLCSIKLNRRGEPMYHPKLPQMVRYAKDKGILEVQFNSNAMLLNDKLAEELILSGLDKIIFSLDGSTKETFEKIRAGANFETVVGNINKFIDMRNQMGRKTPHVRVQLVKMDENENEVDDFIDMWIDKANTVAVNTRREPYVKGQENGRGNEQFPCQQVWQRMNIWWSGEVTMCCGDWHGEHQLGDANTDNLYDLWHGKKYSSVRKLHVDGEFKKLNICSRCEFNTPRYDEQLQKRYDEQKG